MSQYQTAIIPVDNTLNHLETALNAKTMKSIFQQQMCLDQSATIVDCQIERIKYKPQKNCHVSYRLSIKNHNLNSITEQLVCSRFYERCGSVSRFIKESAKNPMPGRLLHIPELDCVTWVFPNDRKLNHLHEVIDSGFLNQHIAPILVNKYAGVDWSIKNFQTQMIRYVPEQSCSVRVELDIEDKYTSKQKTFVAFGKTSYNNSGATIFQLMRQLWQSSALYKQQINIPKPLLYHSELRMFWQSGVPGLMLSELQNQPTVFIKSVENVGKQLGLLHQIPMVGCQRQDQTVNLQELTRVKQLLYKFNAPAKNKILLLINRLEKLLPLDPSRKYVTLHGDLHLKNILVDGEQIYLIDLDNICIGSPLQDIGSFIAAILNLELMASMPSQLAKQSIHAFLSCYRQSVPWSINELSLRKHVALALIVERVFRSFTRLKSGRLEIIENLALEAEMLLDNTFTPDWLQTGECHE